MKLKCPNPGCRSENDSQAERCCSCGIPFRQYAKLSIYSAQLFNRGLAAAKEGNLACARDAFSAVVAWCPVDREARNALAMACLALGDLQSARVNWENILEKWPDDELAKRGMQALGDGSGSSNGQKCANPKTSQDKPVSPEKKKPRKVSRKKRRKKKGR